LKALSAVEPIETPVNPTKFLPEMTTEFPPDVGPLSDTTESIAGRATGKSVEHDVVAVWKLTVTVAGAIAEEPQAVALG
jgi:hypothetical protein